MAADLEDQRPAPDPAAGGGVGVEVVDGPAAGVRSVQSVPGRPYRRFRHRLVELAVHHAGKSPRLVYHPGDGVGKGGVLHPVEDHRPHRHLAAVGLSPGLRRDHPGQQVHAGILTAGGAAAHAQSLQGGRSHDAVGRQAVFPLKIFYRLGGLAAEYPVYRPVVIAPVFQLGLDDAHLFPAGPLPEGHRLGLLGQGNERNVDREHQSQRRDEPASVHTYPSNLAEDSVRPPVAGYVRQSLPDGIPGASLGNTGSKQERMWAGGSGCIPAGHCGQIPRPPVF